MYAQRVLIVENQSSTEVVLVLALHLREMVGQKLSPQHVAVALHWMYRVMVDAERESRCILIDHFRDHD